MDVLYTPTFVKRFSALDRELQEEALFKIDLFQKGVHQEQLKIHKLKGKLAGRCSFSVNYRYRIVFLHQAKKRAILLSIGDHDIYK